MDYNITQNILKDGYDNKEEITPEKLNFILEKLKEATELAKTITINNMKKEDLRVEIVNVSGTAESE